MSFNRLLMEPRETSFVQLLRLVVVVGVWDSLVCWVQLRDQDMPFGPWLYAAYLYQVFVVPTSHASRQISGVSCRVASLIRHEWSTSFRLTVRDTQPRILH